MNPSLMADCRLSANLAPYSRVEGLFLPLEDHLPSPFTSRLAPSSSVLTISSSFNFSFIPSLSASFFSSSGLIHDLLFSGSYGVFTHVSQYSLPSSSEYVSRMGMFPFLGLNSFGSSSSSLILWLACSTTVSHLSFLAFQAAIMNPV